MTTCKGSFAAEIITSYRALEKRLPKPEAILSASYVPPRTQVERVLCGIWQQLLKLERSSYRFGEKAPTYLETPLWIPRLAMAFPFYLLPFTFCLSR